jgi:outer membrane protein assembly factor BamB
MGSARLRQGLGRARTAAVWREGAPEGASIPRYYSGVWLRRTTISCVALVIFATLTSVWTATANITFPLQVKWSAALSALPAYAAAFDDAYVYVPLRSNELVALKLEDGTKVWSVECPVTAAPAAGDGLVYVGREGVIQGRSHADGLVRWERPVTDRIVSLYWDTGWLLASTESGPLTALRAIDGEILWQRELGSPLSAPPAPAGDRLYVPLRDGRIIAMALETGDEIWTHKLADAAVGIVPLGDRLFVGARDNQFHVLDARNADTDWRWRTGADLLGLPAVDAKRVYFIALDNVLRGHNRSGGSMLWKRVLPMRPISGPILIGQTLVVSGVAAELRGYSATDGKPVGEFTVKGAENEEMLLAAAPYVAANDVLVLITKGGQVRAVHSSPASPRTAPGSAPKPAPPADAQPPDAVAAPDPATTPQP